MGLPTSKDTARGRDLNGAWPKSPPRFSRLKGDGGRGGGIRALASDPYAVLGTCRLAAPHRGRAGTGDRVGVSDWATLGTGACWEPQRALGIVANAALSPTGPGPCLRLRLPTAKPAAAGPTGACAASCAQDLASAWGLGGGSGGN